MRPIITQERLKELLNYNPSTGIFKWKFRPGVRGREGVAGSLHPTGYWKIKVDGRQYMAHSLAWLYVFGWLPNELDHANGIRHDNRICNLRPVTHSENMQNQRAACRDNKSGFLGVVALYKGFQAQIVVAGRKQYLGTFKTAQEAHEVYVKAKRQLHKGGLL